MIFGMLLCSRILIILVNLEMLTILVKTIANNSNNTLAKNIADTNTSTFVTILFTVYYIQHHC